MSNLSEQLGKRISEIRKARGIKQSELAELIDIEATNLSKIERGIHLPKIDKIYKITKALNIEVRDLFDFGHIKTKDELLKDINDILNCSSVEETRFFYKILISYKEMKW